MSVIVKNMDMPRDCVECPLCNDEYGYCEASNRLDKTATVDERPKYCPLEEVNDLLSNISTEDYIKRRKRMCDYFRPNCNRCPFGIEAALYDQNCTNWETDNASRAVALMSAWEPGLTNFEKFVEVFGISPEDVPKPAKSGDWWRNEFRQLEEQDEDDELEEEDE